MVEIPKTYEQCGPDNFNQEITMADLGERLIAHNEKQIDYYERQKAEAEKTLARVSLMYSGQLQFDLEPHEPREA